MVGQHGAHAASHVLKLQKFERVGEDEERRERTRCAHDQAWGRRQGIGVSVGIGIGARTPSVHVGI